MDMLMTWSFDLSAFGTSYDDVCVSEEDASDG